MRLPAFFEKRMTESGFHREALYFVLKRTKHLLNMNIHAEMRQINFLRCCYSLVDKIRLYYDNIYVSYIDKGGDNIELRNRINSQKT